MVVYYLFNIIGSVFMVWKRMFFLLEVLIVYDRWREDVLMLFWMVYIFVGLLGGFGKEDGGLNDCVVSVICVFFFLIFSLCKNWYNYFESILNNVCF